MQQTLSDHFTETGFTRGVGHPAVFHHAEKDIWTLVHGDDYCSAATSSSLDWLQRVLDKRYKIKSQRIGDGIDYNGVKKQLPDIAEFGEQILHKPLSSSAGKV